ncbi:MAG: hypothetical protein RBT63_06145 [Bdellovibrionales bacterium]|jgi:hypothetical protein|nr:hypothetical protein [Bdellovibrionales bacterium]
MERQMDRQLDPNVFGSQSAGAASGSSIASHGIQQPIAPTPSPLTQPGKPIPYPPIDMRVLEAQVLQMKAVMQQFERRFEEMAARMNEMARDNQGRLDRYGQQLIRLEDGIQRLTADTSNRLAALAGRVNERKVSDSKLQDLIDRHNLLVRNFENRLSSLQKLAGDQEQALLSAFAALEDARADLARLKRL